MILRRCVSMGRKTTKKAHIPPDSDNKVDLGLSRYIKVARRSRNPL